MAIKNLVQDVLGLSIDLHSVVPGKILGKNKKTVRPTP